MSARTVRWCVLAVGAVGIAGMIVSSIADNTDAALTFGLVLAAAVVALMLVTAVVSGTSPPAAGGEEVGAEVERRIAGLVAAGADERAVRALVAEAVRLGRTTAPPSS